VATSPYLLQSFDLQVPGVHLLLSQCPFGQHDLSHLQLVHTEQQLSFDLLPSFVPFPAIAETAISIAVAADNNLRFIILEFKN
jgi:hypothetical protein